MTCKPVCFQGLQHSSFMTAQPQGSRNQRWLDGLTLTPLHPKTDNEAELGGLLWIGADNKPRTASLPRASDLRHSTGMMRETQASTRTGRDLHSPKGQPAACMYRQVKLKI